MDRYLRGSGDTLRFTLYVNGELTDSEEDVTVSIVDGAGTAVGAPATAAHPSLGVYERYPTAAQMNLLDTYTASWTVTLNGEARTFTTQYEVVGGFYFSVAEAKAFEGGKLANVSTQSIVDEREEIESQFEDNLGFACVLRGYREVLNGDGTNELALSKTRVRAIYSVSLTDSSGTVTDYDAADLADLAPTEYGFLHRRSRGVFTSGYRVSVHYVHGETSLPGGAKRMALKVLKNRLITSDVSDRALSFTNDAGTLQYSTANGLQRPFGLPEVDAWLWKTADHAVHIA